MIILKCKKCRKQLIRTDTYLFCCKHCKDAPRVRIKIKKSTTFKKVKTNGNQKKE